jgi:hypothetical protein
MCKGLVFILAAKYRKSASLEMIKISPQGVFCCFDSQVVDCQGFWIFKNVCGSKKHTLSFFDTLFDLQ